MKLLIKILIPIVLFVACSELDDNIVNPDNEINIHQDGVNNKSSDNFHGSLVKTHNDKLGHCQSCHAGDYSGGTADVDCADCHKAINVHNKNTTMISHRNYIQASNSDMNQCQQCHGDDYSGGVASPACSTCHTGIAVHAKGTTMISHRDYIGTNQGDMSTCYQCHGDDFTGGLASPSCVNCHSSIKVHTKDKEMMYHRQFIADNGGDMAQCQQCHGDDYSGGVASPTCATCHSGIKVHEKGSTAFGHISFLRNSNWQLESCKGCHSSDYSGGLVSSTCLTCHPKPNGPENCSTCHFDNDYKPGNTFHSNHLNATIGNKVECSACHVVPTNVDDNGHLDGNQGVELIYSGVAVTTTNELGTEGRDPNFAAIIPVPVFDKATGSCSNVYCHGYFKNGNLDNVIKYGDPFECGSCHGDKTTGNPLPKGNHPKVATCSLCHSTVDANRQIVKPEQHINGKLNVYGQERNY